MYPILKVIGGMRGMIGLLWETSLLDPEEVKLCPCEIEEATVFVQCNLFIHVILGQYASIFVCVPLLMS